MLKRHYDYSVANKDDFKPTPSDEDSSHTIPPYPSVYTIDTKPAVMPKPAVTPAVTPASSNSTTPASSNSTTPAAKPTHNPKKFMPGEHTNNENSSTATPSTVKKSTTKSSSTMVYLISGIGALIFVILMGVCCYQRG